jgi:dTDP-4-dehydrorhamnose 3,5-epimerase
METTIYKVAQTSIKGLLDIDVSLMEDNRGWFQEKFQKQKLVEQGFPKEFVPVQHSLSYNKTAGITRGIHAEPWDKYISVITGKILAVFVDLRQNNFGKVHAIEVTPAKAVFVPKGVGNSFQTLVDETYYTYLVNAHWSEDAISRYRFVNLADPDLDIAWQIPLSQAVISERDKKHPLLKDVTPFDQ